MNKNAVHIAAVIIGLIVLAQGAWAETVMISYDVFLDVDQQSLSSDIVKSMPQTIENKVATALFDHGHIVFNAPGSRYDQSTGFPDENGEQTTLSQLSREAKDGGASYLLYLKMTFARGTDNSPVLSTIGWELLRVDENPGILSKDTLQYQRADKVDVNSDEASTLLITEMNGTALFKE